MSIIQNLNLVLHCLTVFSDVQTLLPSSQREIIKDFFRLISFKSSLIMFILKLLIEKGIQFLYIDMAWNEYFYTKKSLMHSSPSLRLLVRYMK